MPFPISLATIGAIAYLGGLFTMQVGRAVVMSLLVFATWVLCYHRGNDFPAYFMDHLLVDYVFVSVLLGLVGAFITTMFKFHPIMDGLHLAAEYREEKTGRVMYARIGRLLAKILVVLVIFLGAHISLEIHDPDWPFVWAGVVCTGGILLGWIAFYFLLRDELKLFRPAPIEPGTRRRSFWKAEITNYGIIAFVGHVVYVTAYWVWQLVYDNDVLWITSNWGFYSALIIGGILLVVFLIASFFVRRITYDAAPSSPEAGYTPLAPVTTPEEPAVTPSAGWVTGSYLSPSQLSAAGYSSQRLMQ